MKMFEHDGELKHHIVTEHSMDDVAETLVSKTFKIHEKIEFWGARHPMVVKEFESLLENSK